MWCIVTDEQHGHASKAARREAVALRSPLATSTCLRVAPLRDCAALLASGLLRAIPTIAGYEDRP